MNSYYVCLLVAVFLSAISQILLKKSANSPHKSLLKEYLNHKVIISYSILVITTLLNIFAYKGIPYKNGPIIESLGYVFVLLLSKVFLDEKLTVKKIVGNVIILLGILIFYI